MLVTVPGLFARREFQFQKQVTLMAAFTGLILVSWLPHGWFGGVLASMQIFIPLGIVFFLTAFNVRSIRQLRILRWVLLAVTMYLAGRGLIDYFWNPDDSPFVMMQNYAHDVVLHRLQAQGLLGDPNAFAQFLLAMLPLLFVGMKNRSWSSRIFVILPMGAIMLAAIFLTHSRGALVGMVILIGVLVRQHVRFAAGGLATAVAAIVLIAAGFTGGRSISIGGGMDRLDLWSDGLGLFKSSPLWGIGYNGFVEKEIYTAHNSFLLCAAELGLIGLFIWLAIIIVSLWQLRRVVRMDPAEGVDPELRSWANAIFLALVGFLAPGFFLSETYAPMLLLLLGMSATVTRLAMVENGGVELLPERNRWALKTAAATLGTIGVIYIMVRLRAV
jgi:O-antigen ligase